MVNGQALYLSARDRSYHLIIIGAIGTGKTVSMEGMIRQDIRAGRGCCVIDPMGALFHRILAYCCYLKAIGAFVNSIWLTLIVSFGPPKTPIVPRSAFGTHEK
jgi:hypothetical protein